MSDDLFSDIYNKSLDLLSRREHSKKEIKDIVEGNIDADPLFCDASRSS